MNASILLAILIAMHPLAYAEEPATWWEAGAKDKAAATAEAPASATAAEKEATVAKKPKAKKQPKEPKLSAEPKSEPAKVAEEKAPSAAAPSAQAPAVAPPPAEPLSLEQKDNLTSIILKTPKQCVVVEFNTLPNGELSCKDPVAMKYTKRDCASSNIVEIGETEAQASCPTKKRVELLFRTSTDAVRMKLKVNRQSAGRAGTKAIYSLSNAAEEDSEQAKALAQPKLKPLNGEAPAESPLKLKFTGFAALEWEKTKNFGYDATSGIRNFDSRVAKSSQNNTNFMTNFGFEATRDQTSFVSVFQVGEVYFGDTASGGGQGGKATNVFAVRNLYINHAVSEKLGAKGGIISTNADTRAFIFSDQISSVQAAYKTDLSEGLLWIGDAARNKQSTAHARDRYLGAMGTLGFLTGLKATVYGIHRQKDSDQLQLNDSNTVVTGDSSYDWLGATVEKELFPGFTVQGTGIGNWVKTKFVHTSGLQKSDSFNGNLFDVKLTKSWEGTSIVAGLEGLATSGASGVTDATSGKQIQGKRHNFVSPVGTAYLLSIATSDGLDDAPGTAKESTIANLNQDEGLNILVANINGNLTNKTSAFIRYGYVQAANGSAVSNKKHIGDEGDLGLVYQMTPSTALQIDYGFFQPGSFFNKRSGAQLLASKLKFSF